MIISFSNTPLVIVCALALLILATHVLPLFLDKAISRWLTPIGALLHPVAFILLFFAGAELDLVVLSLVVSVFIYSLVGYISYLKEKKGEEQK